MTDTTTATIERIDIFSPGSVWLIHYRQGNVCGVFSTNSPRIVEKARTLVGKTVRFSSAGRGSTRRLVRVDAARRQRRHLLRPRRLTPHAA